MKFAKVLLLGALGLSIRSASWAQCTGCFATSFADVFRAYPAPSAEDLAAADFDEDGAPDLVIAAGDTIGFLRGSGSGSFAPPVSYASAGSNSITTADFNGDGHADVATSGANVSIFLGNGDGSFQPPIEYTPDFSAYTFIETGELNGDGIPDLVVDAFDPTYVRIYIGQGDGTFAPPLQISGPLPQGLALGDFDGDGLTDIAVSGFSGELSTYLNDGQGGFSDARITTGTLTGELASGDFNHDGMADLAMARFDDVVALLANGDGTFAESDVHVGGAGPNHVVVDDFDRDGVLDLAYSVDQIGTVTTVHGHGDGTFGPEVVTLAGDQLGPLVSADFDSNSWPDLAVRTFPTVEVLLAAAGGGFPVPPDQAAGAPSNDVVAGDFMGTGHMDLATNAAVIVPGLGNGSLDGPVSLPITGSPMQVAAGSFASGGGMDLAIATTAGIEIALSNGDGTFDVKPPFGSASALAPADFNGDGKLDLAWVGTDLSVALGNGDGTFGAAETYAGLGGAGLTVGHFDAGATPDIAVSFFDHFVVMLGNGDGTFTEGESSPLWYWSLPRITSGDFDDDGHDDLAVALWGYEPVAYISWGNGDGTFEDPATVPSASWPQALLPADVNGDGKTELVTSGIQAVHILTFLPDRSSVSWEAVKPNIGAGTALADMFEDGRPDLVLAGGVAPLVQIYRNTNCEPRRLVVATQAESCNEPGQPFGTQPVLHVVDDGDNVVTCDTGTVVAALNPSTPNSGGSLGGTTAIPAVAGVAAFTDLSIDLPGRGYRLSYTHLLTIDATLGRTMTQGLDVGIVGPAAGVRNGSGRISYVGIGLRQGPVDPRRGAGLAGRARRVLEPPSRLARRRRDRLLRWVRRIDVAEVVVQTAPATPVIVAPDTAAPGETGLVASVSYHDSSLYHWIVIGGTLTSGQGTNTITFDAGPPGTTMRLTVVEQTSTNCVSDAASADVRVDFLDVPSTSPFHHAVTVMALRGITAGCGGGNFCPSVPMTRAQAAVLLLKAEHGADYSPWPAAGIFNDVPPGSFAADWIETLVAEGITAGCGDGNFCPDNPVTRAQIAVWLLKAEHGSDYVPPPCDGVFADVSCAPPAFAVDWIENLYAEGVTGGCQADPLVYCPDATVTRAQAAAMIVRTFNLQ